MRITFVLPYPDLSGGVRVVTYYAEQLRARGHTVTIDSQPPAAIPFRAKVKSLLKRRGWPRPVPAPSHLDQTDLPHIVIDRPRPVSDSDLPDADVVIATWWETAYWVRDLADSKGRKFYFVQGHEVFPYLDTVRSAASYRLPLKKITIAQWLVDVMAQSYDDHDVALCPNGVDRDHFSVATHPRQPKPVVGLVYSMAEIKGADISLAAIARVKAALPDLQILAFGSQPVAAHLPLPPESRYHLAPQQEEIPQLYGKMDALIWASRSEGFGLPILEALACGTPVIATAAGCARDIIVNGENGYVVDIDDVDALAARLKDVLSLQDTEWQAMSARARASTEGWEWESSVDKFEQILLEGVADPA